MLVELEVAGHGNDGNHAHPGAKKVAALRGSFSGLEQEQQCLDCAQSRDIHEALHMPWIHVSN